MPHPRVHKVVIDCTGMNMMMERKPIMPKPAESFSKQEEDFFNSPANPDTMRPAEDTFKSDDEKVDTELVSANEEAFIESPASTGEFSNDEKMFFDETKEEESLFEKSAAELNQSIAERETEDNNALIIAKEKLALANEDEQPANVEQFPTKQPEAFNELEQKFFDDGEATNKELDQDDNSSAEGKMAS